MSLSHTWQVGLRPHPWLLPQHPLPDPQVSALISASMSGVESEYQRQQSVADIQGPLWGHAGTLGRCMLPQLAHGASRGLETVSWALVLASHLPGCQPHALQVEWQAHQPCSQGSLEPQAAEWPLLHRQCGPRKRTCFYSTAQPEVGNSD